VAFANRSPSRWKPLTWIDFPLHAQGGRMNTRFSFPLKLALLLAGLLILGLACNFSTTTTDNQGTAQALQTTNQALEIKMTDAAAHSSSVQSANQTPNVNAQATTTAQALHILQTANALSAKATSDAYAAQSNQQSQGAGSASDNTNAAATVSFDVINQSAATICRIYFSPPQEGQWLQQDAVDVNIPPDYQQSLNVQSGEYDLRVEDCSGASIEEYYNIQIPTYHTWVVAGDSSTGGQEPLCGDGYCEDFEHPGNCPQDCDDDDGPLCGDGYCGDFENPGNCPQDCGSDDGPLCGDGYCGDFENSGNCPQDCDDYDGPLCGDGYCGDFENPGNCPQDCP
jgi:hypothetical protein